MYLYFIIGVCATRQSQYSCRVRCWKFVGKLWCFSCYKHLSVWRDKHIGELIGQFTLARILCWILNGIILTLTFAVLVMIRLDFMMCLCYKTHCFLTVRLLLYVDVVCITHNLLILSAGIHKSSFDVRKTVSEFTKGSLLTWVGCKFFNS